MVAMGTLMACSKKAAEPTKGVDPKATTPVATAAAKTDDNAGGDGKLDPNDPKHGTRKLKGLDTPVYVDGAQVAVLRAGELPQMPSHTLEGGAIRYRIYDYLNAIGVKPESIQSIHFHGNQDRVASVEKSELLKQKDRFEFQFQGGNSGLALQEWDTEGLKNEFVANEIRRVTIYVTKKSPAIHPQNRCHLGADGECSDAIPYATGEVAKGTRIYVDGKMIGFVKRRQIGAGVEAGETANGEHKYSVAKLAAQMGVEPSSINSMELVAGDDVIGRGQLTTDITFTLPKHNHGKVRVHVPAQIQMHEEGISDRDALVSAVLLYKNTKPNNRDLTAISDMTDLSVQLAAVDDARGRGER